MAAKEFTDKQRLDWLEQQYVAVRIPLRYGSRECFIASSSGEDGDDTSDLRKQIDAQLRKE